MEAIRAGSRPHRPRCTGCTSHSRVALFAGHLPVFVRLPVLWSVTIKRMEFYDIFVAGNVGIMKAS